MNKEKNGFTLVETLIGIIIFSAAATMFYWSVRAATKESVFSGNHFSALMLSQKVSEDIMEEFSVNPYGDETLLLNSKEYGHPNLIEGNSIFFAALEDTKAPWGLIDSATDGGIDSHHATLYAQLKGFVLSTSSHDEYFSGFSQEAANLKKINLSFSWKTNLDQGLMGKEFYVFAPREAKNFADPFANLDYESLGLEDAVKALLPGNSDFSKPLPEIISSLGGDEKILFELAAAQILCSNFFNSPMFLELTKENTTLNEELPWVTDPRTILQKRKKIADNWYCLSQTAISVVAAVSQILSTFDKNEKVEAALEGLDQFQLRQYLMNVKMLYRYLLNSLAAARYNLQLVFSSSDFKILETLQQEKIILKLLDIYRILAFAPGYDNGKSEYTGFIKRAKQMFNWKNRSLYRFFDYEENLALDQNKLLKNFPNLQLPHKILTEQVPKTFAFIQSQLE